MLRSFQEANSVSIYIYIYICLFTSGQHFIIPKHRLRFRAKWTVAMLSYLSGQHVLTIRNHLGQFNIAMEAIAYLSSMIYLVKVVMFRRKLEQITMSGMC